MRVGVFGGSFDPVHTGHLKLARAAAQQLRLDQVRFVPASLQPLKRQGPQAGPEDRVAMLRLAISGEPGFVLDGRELSRPGPSFTVDTLREITTEHPDDRLFLILGADAVREFPRWRAADEVAKLAGVVVIPRPGSETRDLPAGATVLDIAPMDVSASGVRAAVRRGVSIDTMVPAGVAQYIHDHGLYRTGA